jgi:hypothetical protein
VITEEATTPAVRDILAGDPVTRCHPQRLDPAGCARQIESGYETQPKYPTQQENTARLDVDDVKLG